MKKTNEKNMTTNATKGVTTMQTTNNTNNARMNAKIEQAKARNEQRLASTKANIEQASTNNDNIINAKAVEIIQTLKTTHDINNATITNDLYIIASVLCHSKLKALNNDTKTYNENNVELKKAIAQIIDTDNGNGTKYGTKLETLNSLYITRYNNDGEKIVVCTDEKRARQIEQEFAELTDNSGLPIVHDAIVKIWYYLNKAVDKYGMDNMPDTALLDTFELVIPSSKAYRKSGNIKPKELWQYRTTNAIKETSLEISRQINDMKRVKDTTVSYYEFATIDSDESDEQEPFTSYRKANKISIEPTTDINGNIITQTANTAAEKLIETILEETNFTKNESVLFKWHILNDISLLECADRLKVSEQYIRKTLDNIRRKCASLDIVKGKFKEQDTKRANNDEKRVHILAKRIDDETIIYFDSIGKASEKLNISKGHISEVLKGKRKTANGYTFALAD